jgi:2-oxoglutarate ferredoxin oxidoreductase subunit beta
MPALVAGIHALLLETKDVDGRVKPGHDGGGVSWGLVLFILHRN